MKPFQVGVNSNGTIQHMNYDFYQDNGYVLSMVFSYIAMNSYENCYDKSKWKFNCYNATTDTARNSWLRCPGMLQCYFYLLIVKIMSYISLYSFSRYHR